MDAGAKAPAGELERLREEVLALKAELRQLKAQSGANQGRPGGREQLQTPPASTTLKSGPREGLLEPQEADHLLRMVQSLADVSIWRWDRTKGVSECSSQLRDLFGLEEDVPFRLQDVYERFHPEDRSKIRFDGRGQSANEVLEPGEFRVIRPDGTVRHIISTAAPLRGPADADVWVGLVVDVTDRHLLQEELKNAQKMEALGRLAGGVAHDFNNYLTVALGNAEMLRAGVHQNNTTALLDEIIAASERCQALTRRLIEFGRKTLVKAPVINILDVVAQSQAILRRMLPASMVLKVQTMQPELRVRIDPGKLDQTIMNLVLNARDATHQDDTITLSLHTKEGPPPGKAPRTPTGEESTQWVCIGVRDHGMGMDQETKSRVFEPFFTTKPAGRGTGLGLSIVYGIVAQAGGCMSVQSTPGQGSCFEVWLPLAS